MTGTERYAPLLGNLFTVAALPPAGLRRAVAEVLSAPDEAVDVAHTIDAVASPIAELPHVPVSEWSEIVRDLRANQGDAD
ncbi:hypothetical protein ABZT08_19870 [Streptomyces sp. NPDC005526]|uniref:hypothetical protein n=1 Tax=Streptomyces sp. NPDC005526 TaxID=3156885 RepID=UPI0033BA6D15